MTPEPAVTLTRVNDDDHARPQGWRTVGIKHLPDSTVLRLQLHGTTLKRRVQRRAFKLLWRTLPEALAVREALVWNYHLRPAIDRNGQVQQVSVFMALPVGTRLLGLTNFSAERSIVSLFATVEDTGWYDEEQRRWRPMRDFFAQN